MALATRAPVGGILSVGLLMLGSTQVMAGSLEIPRADAEIRVGGDSYEGNDIYNADASGQTVIGSGAVGEILTFWIQIGNDRNDFDSFKVKRSGRFHDGYRVRYYSATGKDVTGQVNAGSFTTPELAPHGTYVMKATVKVRPFATQGSSVSRYITVSSVDAPGINDSVRFVAAFGFPSDADLTLNPGELIDPGQYQYEFQTAEVNGQADFTVQNEGTGPSPVLLVSLSTPGNYQLANDTCTGTSVSAGGSCSFRVNFIADTYCETLFIGSVAVAGGAEDLVDLQVVAVCDLI